MNEQLKEKDPAERLDYFVDYAELGWLGDDTLDPDNTYWTTPAGIEQDGDYIAGGRCVVWLKGGTVPDVYEVVNHAETMQGRITERTLYIQMVEK